MAVLWRLLAGFGVLFHLVAFALESLLWMRPEVHGRFGVDLAGAETTRLIFFNQGFYNLFLALGLAAGLALVARRPTVGRTLVAFTCLSMAGAGAVLAFSAPEKIGAACVQGAPPLLALILARQTWQTGQTGQTGQGRDPAPPPDSSLPDDPSPAQESP